MQFRFEKRSGKYLTIQGSYTLSRNTDDVSAGNNSWVGWYSVGGPQALDQLKNETTLSANNATHRVAAAFTANIPVGRGLLIGNNMNRVADAVIGGWSGLFERDVPEWTACGHPDGHQSSGRWFPAAQRHLLRSRHGSQLSTTAAAALLTALPAVSASSIRVASPIRGMSSSATLHATSII